MNNIKTPRTIYPHVNKNSTVNDPIKTYQSHVVYNSYEQKPKKGIVHYILQQEINKPIETQIKIRNKKGVPPLFLLLHVN